MATDILTPLHLAHAELRRRLQVVFPLDRPFGHDTMASGTPMAAWKDAIRRAPFVGIMWDGIKPDPDNGRQFRGALEFAVVLVAKHPHAAGRLEGDKLGIGLYAMIQAAIATLSGRTIPDVGTMQVTAVTHAAGNGWDMGDASAAVVSLHVPGVGFYPGPVLDDLELSGLFEWDDIDWTVNGKAAPPYHRLPACD